MGKDDAARPEPAELMGGLLAAAIAASEGLEGSTEEEFQRACDGMCVSNSMREAGLAPLQAASRWVAESLQPSVLDAGFATACGSTPAVIRLRVQVWQDLQLPGTAMMPAWSM